MPRKIIDLRKSFVFLSLLILMLSLLTACGDKEEEAEDVSDNQVVVFRYGDYIVTKGEVYIYANTVKQRYEMQYGENVWQLSLPVSPDGEDTMINLTRQEVVEEIVRVKTLYSHANEFGVTLNDERRAEIDAQSQEFFNGLTDEDISSMGITKDMICSVITENEIAKAVESKLLENNPVEISDEEARVTTFFDMYFACYSIDESGNVIRFSKEDRDKQYENALQACSTLATAGIGDNPDDENIEKLSDYYGLEQAKEYSMSPEEILETYGDDIYNLLYSMENGAYSTVVESEYGYHVFQMLALTDRKETNARKEIMTKEAIGKQLNSKLAKWQKDIDKDFVYPDSINMEVYDTIAFEQE